MSFHILKDFSGRVALPAFAAFVPWDRTCAPGRRPTRRPPQPIKTNKPQKNRPTIKPPCRRCPPMRMRSIDPTRRQDAALHRDGGRASRCATGTARWRARWSSTAYTVEGANRPVTFAFNGGPGAAVGLSQLRRHRPQAPGAGNEGDSPSDPAILTDNPGTWLDFTDLVFIDPVGTGFSRRWCQRTTAKKLFYTHHARHRISLAHHLRLAGQERPPRFAQISGRRKLRRIPRAAHHALSAVAAGVALNGVVLVSPYLNPASRIDGDLSPLPWMMTLPSITAAHLEREKKLTPEAMADVSPTPAASTPHAAQGPLRRGCHEEDDRSA